MALRPGSIYVPHATFAWSTAGVDSHCPICPISIEMSVAAALIELSKGQWNLKYRFSYRRVAKGNLARLLISNVGMSKGLDTFETVHA
jgi:hypothetical protein